MVAFTSGLEQVTQFVRNIPSYAIATTLKHVRGYLPQGPSSKNRGAQFVLCGFLPFCLFSIYSASLISWHEQLLC